MSSLEVLPLHALPDNQCSYSQEELHQLKYKVGERALDIITQWTVQVEGLRMLCTPHTESNKKNWVLCT